MSVEAAPLFEIIDAQNSEVGYTSLATRRLLVALAALIEAEKVLELGTGSGGTAATMAQVAHVTSVDLADHRNATTRDRFEFVQADVVDYLKNTDTIWDMIFVDDDHEAGHARLVCHLVEDRVSAGGLIVFHDTLGYDLRDIILEAFPQSWDRLNLPSFVPEKHDLGLLILRSPPPEQPLRRKGDWGL